VEHRLGVDLGLGDDEFKNAEEINKYFGECVGASFFVYENSFSFCDFLISAFSALLLRHLIGCESKNANAYAKTDFFFEIFQDYKMFGVKMIE
jgi:hypothetical protein